MKSALAAIFLQRPLLSLLHAFLPAALYFAYASDEDPVLEALTFCFSLLSLVPLAERLGYVTEQLALHVGDFAASLLNVTFGNAPELVVTVIALCQFDAAPNIAQDTLIGSALSNVLLVAGLSFFVGGLRHKVQTLDTTLSSILLAQLFLMALILSLVSCIPLTTRRYVSSDLHGSPQVPVQPSLPPSPLVEVPSGQALAISRILAVAALCVYCAFLVFSLHTHAHLFNGKGAASAVADSAAAGGAKVKGGEAEGGGEVEEGGKGAAKATRRVDGEKEHGKDDDDDDDDDDEDEEDILGLWGSIFWLAVLVGFISWVSDGLVDSIDGAARATGWSELFLTAIILPNVSALRRLIPF